MNVNPITMANQIIKEKMKLNHAYTLSIGNHLNTMIKTEVVSKVARNKKKLLHKNRNFTIKYSENRNNEKTAIIKAYPAICIIELYGTPPEPTRANIVDISCTSEALLINFPIMVIKRIIIIKIVASLLKREMINSTLLFLFSMVSLQFFFYQV
jgi:hypothetical protein